MNQELKQRLTGAVVLVVLGVIFLPMLIEKPTQSDAIRPVHDIAINQSHRVLPEKKPPVVHIPDEVIAQYDETNTPSATLTPSVTETLDESNGHREEKQVTNTKDQSQAHVTEETQQTALSVESKLSSVKNSAINKSSATILPENTKESSDDTKVESEWYVQAGSFSSQANADLLVKRLKGNGFKAFHEQIIASNRPFFRVRLGPYSNQQTAESEKAKLERRETIRTLIVRLPKNQQ